MIDETTVDELASSPPPPLAQRGQRAVGRLLKYRVTFTDGHVEVYDGHAVSWPPAGSVRIYRLLDGAWQMVFGGDCAIIRSVRAIVEPEYARMVKAHANLNTALDHIGQLIAAAPDTCTYDDNGQCHWHPNAGLSDEGQCTVPLARKFLNELRPF